MYEASCANPVGLEIDGRRRRVLGPRGRKISFRCCFILPITSTSEEQQTGPELCIIACSSLSWACLAWTLLNDPVGTLCTPLGPPTCMPFRGPPNWPTSTTNNKLPGDVEIYKDKRKLYKNGYNDSEAGINLSTHCCHTLYFLLGYSLRG